MLKAKLDRIKRDVEAGAREGQPWVIINRKDFQVLLQVAYDKEKLCK